MKTITDPEIKLEPMGKVVLLLLFGVIVLRNAWMCDDAFITLRTVDNFLHGFGLVWNTAERVQAYTHPLWLLCMCLFYGVTREPYFTTLAISGALSVAAFAVLLSRSASLSVLAFVSVALFLSKGVVDFTTSGLENPLSYLLVVLFISSTSRTHPRVFLTSLLFALLALTRMDFVLLALPAFLYLLSREFRQTSSRRSSCWRCAAGLAPVIAWLGFATFYYGFPFPNTAYAKLATGIQPHVYALQGCIYFLNALDTDPVTIVVLALVPLACLRAAGAARWHAVGILLYVAYVCKVGGDFMGTRFLSVPLFAAVSVVALHPTVSVPTLRLTAIGLSLLGLLSPYNPIISGAEYAGYGVRENGIADERGFYYGGAERNGGHQDLGLLRWKREKVMPASDWFEDGKRLREAADGSSEKHVVTRGTVGLFGYAAGPDIHVVDICGLGDPLLARIPARERWRIGHFRRDLPAGYKHMLLTGEDRYLAPGLREYYRRLRLVVSGPLWDISRLYEICRFNLGLNEVLLKDMRLPDALIEPAAPAIGVKGDAPRP